MRIELTIQELRIRLNMLRAPVTRPNTTMTMPIGKVKIVNQGNTPQALELSLSASSTKIDATRAMIMGKNPKTKPPSTINEPSIRRTGGEGCGRGGGKSSEVLVALSLLRHLNNQINPITMPSGIETSPMMCKINLSLAV